MEYFETIKVILCRAGIFQFEFTTRANHITLAKRCGIILIFISYFCSTVWYFVFEAQTPREYAKSLFYVLGSVLVNTWHLEMLRQKDKYAAILDELNSIIEKRLIDPTVNLIYENTRINIEWITKKLTIIFRVLSILFTITPVIVSVFNYITTGFSKDSFLQVYPASYPFDWKTPIGYTACILIQSLTVWAGVESYPCAIMLTVGISMLIADFASDIKEKVRQFNQILISSEDTHITIDDQAILKEKLSEIIEFHAEARDFAIRFSDINEFIILATPSFACAIFGGLILRVNMLIKSGDTVGFVQIVVEMVESLFPFYVFCHFGGNITHQFEDIGNAIYQLEWYRLPLDMQKDLSIIIQLAQKPIYMRGYGDTRTTHSVFKKILKNKFYYFMLTRRF